MCCTSANTQSLWQLISKPQVGKGPACWVIAAQLPLPLRCADMSLHLHLSGRELPSMHRRCPVLCRWHHHYRRPGIGSARHQPAS